MKKSKFTEEQIVFALKEQQQGTKVDVIARKLGISAATFYRWQEQFGSLSVMEVKEMRLLKEENSRLKQLWQNSVWISTCSRRLSHTQPLPERLTDVGTRGVKKL
jgi:putative transposase